MIKDIFDILKELLSFFNIFGRKRAGEQIRKVVQIYDNMHKIVNETDFHRVLVFKAHNGGGLIKPGSELYASCIYEDFASPFKSVKNDYQRLAADLDYTKTLVDIYNSSKITIKTTDLKDGSLLKTIYEGEGVQYAELYFLYQDSKNFYYCSIGTHLQTEELRIVADDLPVQVAINNIRNVMRNK